MDRPSAGTEATPDPGGAWEALPEQLLGEPGGRKEKLFQLQLLGTLWGHFGLCSWAALGLLCPGAGTGSALGTAELRLQPGWLNPPVLPFGLPEVTREGHCPAAHPKGRGHV